MEIYSRRSRPEEPAETMTFGSHREVDEEVNDLSQAQDTTELELAKIPSSPSASMETKDGLKRSKEFFVGGCDVREELFGKTRDV